MLKRVYPRKDNVQGSENPIRNHVSRLRGAITWVIDATTIVSITLKLQMLCYNGIYIVC